MPTEIVANELVGAGQRHNPPGSPVAPYLHGSGGLLNMQGTDTRVMSAIISPMGGLMAELPVISGEYGTAPNSFGAVDEEAAIALTGVTAGDLDTWENQPTTDCADGPTGGLMKMGTYTNPYGRIRGSIREVSLYRAGRLASLCEPLTLTLMNQPTGFGGLAGSSQKPSMQNALMNELASRVFESLESLQRMFSRRLWIGNPATNSGERKDIWGFENQLNTGTHIDRTSSAVLRALDPDVKTFNYNLVGGSGYDIVEYLEEIDNYITWNAEQMGLDPYEYWLVMRPAAFRQITAVWPIRESFEAFRQISRYANTNLNFDAQAITGMRNDMRKNRYLVINGKEVPVILDTSLPEKNVTTASQLRAGQYASDIWMIPKTVRGNLPVTFFKYFNHNNGQEMALAQLAGEATFTSDNGLFRWYVSFKNGCLKLNYEFSPKLMCLAPQLAGRLTNVAYEPLQHERDPYPDSAYYFNGGNTNSPVTKIYTGWSPTTPVEMP
jgi:hypothetical protein